MIDRKKTGVPFKPVEEQGPKFSLTLTRDQWFRVARALEAMARFGMTQFDMAYEYVTDQKGKLDSHRDLCDDAERAAKDAVGLGPYLGASFGVGKDHYVDFLYDLKKTIEYVICHSLADEQGLPARPKDRWTGEFDRPPKYSGQEIPLLVPVEPGKETS